MVLIESGFFDNRHATRENYCQKYPGLLDQNQIMRNRKRNRYEINATEIRKERATQLIEGQTTKQTKENICKNQHQMIKNKSRTIGKKQQNLKENKSRSIGKQEQTLTENI